MHVGDDTREAVCARCGGKVAMVTLLVLQEYFY